MNKDIKYIIVGQGLAGSLLSFQLYCRGINHVVISGEGDNTSSLVAAGMFNPLVFKRITKSWKVDQLMPILLNVYNKLELLLGVRVLHKLPIAKLISPAEKNWWLERVNSQHLNTYFKGFLPSGHLEGIKPSFEFAEISSGGYVDLSTLLLSYQRFLKKNNQLINQRFNFKDLVITDNYVDWKGTRARGIIFCEGAAAENNPFFRQVRFYLTKGEVLEVEIKGLCEDFILNKDAFLLPIGQSRFRLGSTYDRSDLSWLPNEEAAKQLLDKVKKITDCTIKVIDHKAGVRPTISDRRPVLGRHPEFKNIFIFNGLGTKGVMLAPFFSEEMFKLLEIKEYEVDREVDLMRFWHKQKNKAEH